MPVTKTDHEQLKIDVLNFSRTLLLRGHFHKMKMKALAEGKEIKDDSVITPVSCFIPKQTDYPVLKSIVEDLEIYANETQEISKKDVTDNLTQQQRNGLESLKRNKTLVIQEADKGHAVVTLDGDYYKNKMMEELSSPVYQKLERNIDHFINLKLVAFVKKYSFLTDKEKKAITSFVPQIFMVSQKSSNWRKLKKSSEIMAKAISLLHQ